MSMTRPATITQDHRIVSTRMVSLDFALPDEGIAHIRGIG